jgi:phosphohistidine phosphatase
MRTLVIIRHAKAESGSVMNDFNRELSDKGKKDAVKMASILSKQNVRPQLLLTSSAKRAYQTCAIFAAQFTIDKKEIVKKNLLYNEYSVSDLKQILVESAQTRGTVFVFGHNPTLAHIISKLTTNFDGHFPTSGVAVIDFDIDKWDDLDSAMGKMRFFEVP